MPKEAIYGDPQDRFLLEVGWQRDQDVQVGIRTVDGMHLVDEFYGQEAVLERIGAALREKLVMPAPMSVTYSTAGGSGVISMADLVLPSSNVELGRLVLDIVTGSDYGMESLWWHPGRHQINDLIRLLRKARDAAYGRDE